MSHVLSGHVSTITENNGSLLVLPAVLRVITHKYQNVFNEAFLIYQKEKT